MKRFDTSVDDMLLGKYGIARDCEIKSSCQRYLAYKYGHNSIKAMELLTLLGILEYENKKDDIPTKMYKAFLRVQAEIQKKQGGGMRG
jgi:hypothetical protein